MKYRREIDGLRAVAVVPVVFFHAGSGLFSGGFVGVDVFFVISGYLITSIILAEIEGGRFSVVNFYERRARRILPALFLVVAASIPAAWLLLLPADMKSFSQSLIAVPAFASNLLFWRQSGYFGAAADFKPLLHTWSLAVEEQFYVIFPPVLLLLLRAGRRWVPALLAMATVASLFVAEWGSRYHPDAAFFLLPARGWELGMGALTAIYLTKRGPTGGEWFSLLGVGLLLFAVFCYRSTTRFPGLYALVPTIGTVLLIIFATAETSVGRALASKPLVGIGLLSYSVYLWHQPLFAYARHSSAEALKLSVLVGLVLASFVLAYCSWRFVEVPFRQRHRMGRGAVFGMAGIASILFVGVGVCGLISNGAELRYSTQERSLLSQADWKQAMIPFQLRTCFIDYDQAVDVLIQNRCFADATEKRRIVVFGDSEAAHLTYGIRVTFPGRLYHVDQWTGTSCRPAAFPLASQRCQKVFDYFVEHILPRLRERDVLIVAGNWGVTEQLIGAGPLVDALRDALVRFKTSKAKLIVFGNAPDFAKDPVDPIVRQRQLGMPKIYQHAIDYSAADTAVADLVRGLGLIYFDTAAHLCTVRTNCLVYEHGELIFADANHLSSKGSALIAERLISELRATSILGDL